MKKFLALVLALAMTLALAACGGNSQQNSSTPNAGQKEDAQPPADSQGLRHHQDRRHRAPHRLYRPVRHCHRRGRQDRH